MSARPRIPALAAVVFVAAFLATSPAANAGTICGTVRDADTSQPVAQAAVFLYDSTDAYTGIHTATDVSGAYCLDDVAPGRYTIQVKRDDYVTTVLRDVIVTDTASGVDVAAHPALRLRAWPNPASDRVHFDISVPDGARVTLEVFDVRGRLVHGWRGTGTGNQTIGWDLRDMQGDAIASGVYLVRLQTAGRNTTRRFVRFR